jgi:hypothetical protein
MADDVNYQEVFERKKLQNKKSSSYSLNKIKLNLDTDYIIGCCKSKYHIIMSMTAPSHFWTDNKVDRYNYQKDIFVLKFSLILLSE